MGEDTKADARADTLVRVRTRQPGGPWFIELVDALPTPVRLGPYDNPAIAKDEARQLRAYLSALLRTHAPVQAPG